MLNPDGVFLGNYRTAFCGLDLNRQYAEPSEWCTPENFHLKEMLGRLAKDPNIALDFIIDLHSHSTAMNGMNGALPSIASCASSCSCSCSSSSLPILWASVVNPSDSLGEITLPAFCYVNLLENDLAKMHQELLFLRLFR
jgi:hypothetical protein